MRHWLSHILRLALVAGVAVTLAACGGGSGAAPSDSGGGGVIAVEIPALGEISGLPFASGVVITSSSNVAVALKATPGSWVYKTFTLDNSNAFTTGDSEIACEYRNSAGIAIGTFALPDQALCTIKDHIASFTSPYDGNYHIMSTGAEEAGIPSRIKFKIDRGSTNLITNYEEFTCDNTNTQLTYVSYAISGSALTATLKDITSSEPQRSAITVAGTLDTTDSTRFTAKSGTFSYSGTGDAGAMQGYIGMTQGINYLLLDAFDQRGEGDEANTVRIYSQADQSNSSSPLAINAYTFGAGAGNLIRNSTSSEGCWDTSNDPTACSGSNYTAVNGKTPVAASTQTISSFSTADGTAWDCSGTVEVTTSSFSDSNRDSASSCFALFSLDWEYIDCKLATAGSLTVTPSVNGTTLSTNSASPTSVSATPSIVVTGNRAFDTDSLNSTTVTLANNSDTNDTVTLTFTDQGQWNDAQTTLTLTPSLTAGETYKLTLVGSSTTLARGLVIRAPVSSPPPADQLQSTGTYYISVP